MKRDSILTGILKVIAVVGSILLATLIIFLEVAIQSRKTFHVTWHWHVGAGLLIGFCLCAAYLLVRRSSDSMAKVYASAVILSVDIKKFHFTAGPLAELPGISAVFFSPSFILQVASKDSDADRVAKRSSRTQRLPGPTKYFFC